MSKIQLKKQRREDLSLEEVFNKFLAYSNSKNLSEETLEYYHFNFDQFADFMQDKLSRGEESVKISEVTPQIVEEYRLKLLDEDLSTATVNSYLRAVRAFIYYAMKFDYLEDFTVQLIRQENKIKETYWENELVKLLAKPDLKECCFSEYRNWVIVNWIMSTGNRSRTLRNVKIRDLDLEGGYATLRKVKNRKQQLIPLSKELTKIIIEYLQYREGVL